MDFLKEILGDDLFNQLSEKINAYNGNEANKDKQVKLANLGGGDYVGKAKYDALQALLNGKTTELETANTLIADLKKGTKGNEEFQGKVTDYETQVQQLQQQLKETKEKNAVRFMLQEEKCTDVDYVSFKLYEKLKADGKTLELDDDKIKNSDDLISGLKTQFPNQFESAGSSNSGGSKIVEPNKLPDSQSTNQYTKSEILKKPYAERQKIYEENPEAYKAAMNS